MIYAIQTAVNTWQTLNGKVYDSLTDLFNDARQLRLSTVRVIDQETTHSYYVR